MQEAHLALENSGNRPATGSLPDCVPATSNRLRESPPAPHHRAARPADQRRIARTFRVGRYGLQLTLPG
jgi:hypothetical protein